MSSENEKLSFLVEWLEPLSTIPRNFILTFYPSDNSVAMFDVSKKRFFLSRTVCNTVTQPNLFIGNTVNILSRQLRITGYGDNTTRNVLENAIKRSLIVLKPRVFQHLGRFLNKLHTLRIEVKNIRMESYDNDSIHYLQKWSPKSKELVDVLLQSPVILIELSGANTLQWRTIDLEIEDFSTDVFCSEGDNTVKNELGLLFSKNKRLGSSTAKFSSCSSCVIKPHAVVEGNSGKIIEIIEKAGFKITALQMFHLTVNDANEFLEVYKGIIPQYEETVSELASGPCIAMEVQGQNADSVVQDLKKLVGPSDPAIAKTLRPQSLRAMFGYDKVRNGLHCTDLPEDGTLEVEYFFKYLVLK